MTAYFVSTLFTKSLFLGHDFEEITEHQVNRKEFSSSNKRKIATGFIARLLRKNPSSTISSSSPRPIEPELGNIYYNLTYFIDILGKFRITQPNKNISFGQFFIQR